MDTDENLNQVKTQKKEPSNFQKPNQQAYGDKYDETELSIICANISESHKIRIQLGTFFGTVNLTALSIALSTEKAGVLMFAGFLLWLLLYLDMITIGQIAAMYFRLKYKFKQDGEYWRLYLPNSFDDHALEAIASLDTMSERATALRNLRFSVRSKVGFWLPLIGGIFEIGLGLFFWLILGWSLF